MLPPTFFHHLPPSTTLLLLANVFALTDAHAILPRETKTLPHRTLDVELWPLADGPALPTPQPTAAALAPAEVHELLLRRQEANTVCGFIGGDPDLPATCGAGSHCVVDKGLGAIGCCPNGQEGCTTGLFTGCVDFNSGLQTELNPYVFTCGGSDVCYRNVFAGGFSQFGCGTASDLGTTVATRVSSQPRLSYVSVSEKLTGLPIVTLTKATSIGSRPTDASSKTSKTTTKKKSSSSSSGSSSTKTSSTSRSSGAASPTSTDESAEAPESSSRDIDQTGAIIGGTISGVAILIAVVAVGLYIWRRRGNERTGPGHQDTQYISPMTNASNFAPIASSYENAESGLPPSMAAPPAAAAALGTSGSGSPGLYGHPSPYSHGYGGATAGGMIGAAPAMSVEQDRMPLTREVDDFSRGFNDALENIREEDERVSGPPTDTPLWQQNRRQSRNMMWM